MNYFSYIPRLLAIGSEGRALRCRFGEYPLQISKEDWFDYPLKLEIRDLENFQELYCETLQSGVAFSHYRFNRYSGALAYERKLLSNLCFRFLISKNDDGSYVIAFNKTMRALVRFRVINILPPQQLVNDFVAFMLGRMSYSVEHAACIRFPETGNVFLIYGPPGIGKTTLVANLYERLGLEILSEDITILGDAIYSCPFTDTYRRSLRGIGSQASTGNKFKSGRFLKYFKDRKVINEQYPSHLGEIKAAFILSFSKKESLRSEVLTSEEFVREIKHLNRYTLQLEGSPIYNVLSYFDFERISLEHYDPIYKNIDCPYLKLSVNDKSQFSDLILDQIRKQEAGGKF